ncbi:hexosaminidase [Kribbella aluminosa]|uniref:beta-N-acetylhexosaminidase n=1 Tax=Kribbella aluminosa TaxID=416017 RepID=A0ABS4UX89_9ACTN|nr:family 20 glycosylhydrolase [Kribbella aluminosa]MBP2356139.1 hexosaminidase [Kribbella aluminosa]
MSASIGGTTSSAAPATTAASPPETAVQIVPKPVSMTAGQGAFTLTAGTRIRATSPEERAVASSLAADLAPATGFQFEISSGSAQPGDIQLVLADPGTLGADTTHEGYQLDVTEGRITLVAPTQQGLFHGVQSIRQLLPAWIDSSVVRPGPWRIPAVSITDYPRYAYRGVMVDIARHYQTPETVEEIIDQASSYKLNTLHLHLSDDQGFRVVINGFPRLTEIGGRGSVGTQGRTMDPGGFWTQQQYRDVVAYAKAHAMDVVPEVDSPSHNNAIEMSEYGDTTNPLLDGHPQDIACGYKNPPVWNYTIDVGYSGMCPNSANTWAIYTAITNQLAAMSSSPYYHLGGDEAHPFTAAQFADFMKRQTQIVQATGKTPMGWADGYATVAGTTPPPGSIAESWARGAKDGAAAVQKGMKVVMAPADHAYLDQAYPNDTSGLGLNWACKGCDLDVNYNWDPGSFTGVPDSSVLGVEGALWSETTRTLKDWQYLLFPRLLAISELGWSPKASRTGVTSPAFQDFSGRVAAQGARFQAAGVNFYPTSQVPWPITGVGVGATADSDGQVSGTIARVSAPGIALGNLSATIDWGDHSEPTNATISGISPKPGRVNGLYDLAGDHAYHSNGSHTVTVTVTASNGASGTFTVRLAPGGEPPNGHVRVLTLNIHHGADAAGDFDITRAAEVIKASGADVVNLQEVDRNYSSRSNNIDEPAYLAKALNMRVAYGAWLHSPGEYGDAILTKGDITESRTQLLPTNAGSEQRGILEATMTVKGRTFHDYVTHLAYPSVPEAEQQAQAVQEYVAGTPGPSILAGDLNLHPDDPAVRALSGEYTDVWAVAGDGPGLTEPAPSPTERIDYIFASPGVRVRSAAVMTSSTVSDHYPVVADLSLPSDR